MGLQTKSLKARFNPLASFNNQLDILNGAPFKDGDLPYFLDKIKPFGFSKMNPSGLEILQLNMGYMCNQVCAHCHVDAGPDRKEMMSKMTLKKCIQIVKKIKINTLDLTGGAPEMHPDFKWFVENTSAFGVKDFIVRSNLTIIMANRKYYYLPDFFAKHNIHIISSLPFYKKYKTDQQRGEGVFLKSIKALKMLNDVGYGRENSNLKLDLVYNPSGAFLPGNQNLLEKDYKKSLKEEYDIEFNNLYTITNLPISRFLDYLIASENYEDYMSKLVEAFNPIALENIMCKNTLSVRWDGFLYDCDFNQMLDLKVNSPINHIDDFNIEKLNARFISFSQHCYGCTAGSGSSCQGSII